MPWKRSAVRELRKHHGNAAADGFPGLEYRIPAQKQSLDAVRRNPRCNMRTIQIHLGRAARGVMEGEFTNQRLEVVVSDGAND